MAGKEEGSSRTVSVKRAAQLLGVSVDQVRVLLRKGTLVGAKEGRDYAVSIDSVRLLLEEREAATEETVTARVKATVKGRPLVARLPLLCQLPTG